MKGLVLALATLLGGCSISSSLFNDAGSVISANGIDASGRFATDLTSAKFNLDQAMQVGALGVDDPALGCLTNVANDLGIGGDTQIKSFVPKRDGIVSEGAILYIRAQQLKKLANGGQNILLPKDCLALVGQLTIDAAKAGLKVGTGFLPGGGLLGLIPGLPGLPALPSIQGQARTSVPK